MDFYRRSNTHNLDQDGFEDLYRRDVRATLPQRSQCIILRLPKAS